MLFFSRKKERIAQALQLLKNLRLKKSKNKQNKKRGVEKWIL